MRLFRLPSQERQGERGARTNRNERRRRGIVMIIDKFLGRTVEIPEDLKYDAKQGLWGRREGAELVFGLAEPTLVLVGAFVDLSELVNEGESVEKGRAIGVAITTKLKYLKLPWRGPSDSTGPCPRILGGRERPVRGRPAFPY